MCTKCKVLQSLRKTTALPYLSCTYFLDVITFILLVDSLGIYFYISNILLFLSFRHLL